MDGSARQMWVNVAVLCELLQAQITANLQSLEEEQRKNGLCSLFTKPQASLICILHDPFSVFIHCTLMNVRKKFIS